MTQYTNTYGTVYSVRDYKGEPRIMCRAKASCDWLISGTLAVEAAAANTIEGLQQVLDNHARTHGWQPLEGPASAEPPEIVDECSDLDLPYPGDVYRSAKGGQLYKIGELTNGKKTCYLTMRCNVQGGIWVPANSSVYPNLSDAQGEFEAWIRREQLEPVAPTMDAAAIMDELAAKDPFKAGETSITSASGADAGTSLPGSSCKSAPNFSPAPASPADAGVAAQNLCAAEPASLEAKDINVPAFDYSGLDDQTVADLHLAEREYMRGRKLAEVGLRRMADGVAMAHDALCCTDATNCRNGDGRFIPPEHSFGAWCDSVGLNRKAAERLLQVARLFDNSTPREEKVLEELGHSLLYAAAKPSAPAELVQAVKDGDITSHKQYQDLLARYNAEKAAREKAEHEAALDRKEQEDANSAALRYKNECDRRAQDQQRLEGLVNTAKRERDDALRRTAKAENRAAGAQKLADQRGDENTALKAQIRDLESRPVEVAVAQPGEEQIEAWRKEGENRAAAALQDRLRKADQAKADAQRQVNALQTELAAARPDADACQRTADTLYETTENLRLLLRTQLRQAQLTPADYGNVVAHVLLVANALRDTVRNCAPAGYTMDDDEEDFL